MGLWYEITRDSEFHWEKDASCVTAFYSANEDGTVAILNSQMLPGGKTRDKSYGTATCDALEGRCSVKFFYVFSGDYRVVDSDYENYSIVYSCKPSLIYSGSSYNVWILAREKTISTELKEKLIATIKKQIPHYDISWFEHTVQGTSCNYEGAL